MDAMLKRMSVLMTTLDKKLKYKDLILEDDGDDSDEENKVHKDIMLDMFKIPGVGLGEVEEENGQFAFNSMMEDDFPEGLFGRKNPFASVAGEERDLKSSSFGRAKFISKGNNFEQVVLPGGLKLPDRVPFAIPLETSTRINALGGKFEEIKKLKDSRIDIPKQPVIEYIKEARLITKQLKFANPDIAEVQTEVASMEKMISDFEKEATSKPGHGLAEAIEPDFFEIGQYFEKMQLKAPPIKEKEKELHTEEIGNIPVVTFYQVAEERAKKRVEEEFGKISQEKISSPTNGFGGFDSMEPEMTEKDKNRKVQEYAAIEFMEHLAAALA